MSGDLDQKRKELERILGLGPIGGPREIPGLGEVAGREFLYVRYRGSLSDEELGDLFDKVVRQVTPPVVRLGGGAMSENCTLTLPSGASFFGLSYKGDLDGWRRQIEQGARLMGLSIGRIAGDRLVIDDGREVLVRDCSVRFF